jgi:hypothetical protein
MSVNGHNIACLRHACAAHQLLELQAAQAELLASHRQLQEQQVRTTLASATYRKTLFPVYFVWMPL